MGYLVDCDEQCISELHDVKVPSLGVTQHFVDEINWMMDPAISAQPPPPSTTIVVLTTLPVADM
jgi:hypothetical protein